MKMKELKCEMCGSSNIVQDGTQYLCQACGTKFSAENLDQNDVVPSNNQTPQQVNEANQQYNGTPQQYDATAQPYNNGQNTAYQQQVPRQSKSMAVSLILSFLFLGIGLAYLGLIKRWLVAVVISVILSIVFFPLGAIWNLYLLYDTYACTKAINEGQPIPKLAGFLEME
jgi:hypothetical protein